MGLPLFGLSLLVFLIVGSHSLECTVRERQLGSPSECRCWNAIQYGFTDEPPFDGQTVTLKFNEDYNVTELEETIAFLGPTRVVSHDFDCFKRKKQEKQEEEERAAEQKKEDQRVRILKEKREAYNVIQKCEDHEREINDENAKKWWWQEKAQPISRSDGWCECRQSKRVKEEWEWEYELLHPCRELGCESYRPRRCYDMTLSFSGPPGWVPPCVYSIRLKTN